jgi:nicotinate dehydrogenase subunit B
VRFREPPFTPDRIRAGLGLSPQLAANRPGASAPGANEPNASAPNASAPSGATRPRKPWRSFLSGASFSVALLAAVFPWRSEIDPIAPPDAGTYSAATIERGRQLAALGDCAVCHTADGGITNAGGRPLSTPFGTVYATNITPDAETGLGSWSFAAFERAMRQGIHRDGRHLYPAFPYNHFTRVSEGDLQALYAFLMAQQPVRQFTPLTALKFPFSVRPLMSLWNALFLKSGTLPHDATQSESWNRGKYLVEGLGHCAGCHSPRNALGAEAGGAHHLAGGWVDGWEAPALTQLSHAPMPWSKQDLIEYLRTGYSALHGSAAGPMAPVITQLAALPDADIDAMASYLSSFNTSNSDAERRSLQVAIESQTAGARFQAGAQLYEGACAVCHYSDAGQAGRIAGAQQGFGRPDVFGINSSLAFNTNLHSERPDNLVRVIMEGVATDRAGVHGAMPSFEQHLDDEQLTTLLTYLRGRFAPGQPMWSDLPQTIARIRTETALD